MKEFTNGQGNGFQFRDRSSSLKRSWSKRAWIFLVRLFTELFGKPQSPLAYFEIDGRVLGFAGVMFYQNTIMPEWFMKNWRMPAYKWMSILVVVGSLLSPVIFKIFDKIYFGAPQPWDFDGLWALAFYFVVVLPVTYLNRNTQ